MASAAVTPINKWEDARPYLEMLAQTIVNDIVPLLSTPGRAPHTVAREVFSYVDHLGHLFTGSSQVGDRFRSYLRDVMNRLDENYARWADEIYEMYRNGPVHEFDPKVLENDQGQQLGWLSYAGQRHEPKLKMVDGTASVTHLTPVQLHPGDRYHLPVSTICLVADLLCSIRELIRGVGPKSTQVTAWNKAAVDLEGPKHYNFSLT